MDAPCLESRDLSQRRRAEETVATQVNLNIMSRSFSFIRGGCDDDYLHSPNSANVNVSSVVMPVRTGTSARSVVALLAMGSGE